MEIAEVVKRMIDELPNVSSKIIFVPSDLIPNHVWKTLSRDETVQIKLTFHKYALQEESLEIINKGKSDLSSKYRIVL